jgi:hypothetical protein
MRLPLAILLGAVVGAQTQGIVGRQNGGDEETTSSETSVSSDVSSASSTTTSDRSSTTDVSTTRGGDQEQDTTVFQTVTVTDDNVKTVSSLTTIYSTNTKTVTVTVPVFKTTTVTVDGETSTDTIFETSTQWVEKRDLSPRTLDEYSQAAETAATTITSVPADWPGAQPAQNVHELAKRATITRLTTVTADGDGEASTVISTVRLPVVTSVIETETSESILTKTAIKDAKTTVTTTSTVVVTSTSVNSAVSTGAPEDNGGNDQSNNGNNGNNNQDQNKDEGGLSTGAKAGIGAGAGVAGLALIAGLIWFCIKRRRDPKTEHDDLMGASEVPVSGPFSGGQTPATTAHHSAAAAFLAPGRMASKQSQSNEGYRGTAMGDGRAGFAKPAPYGSAYAGAGTQSPATAYSHPHTDRSSTLVSRSPDDLPEHPSPLSASAEMARGDGYGSRYHDAGGVAEIDSRPAPQHQDGPVYEMPGHSYR